MSDDFDPNNLTDEQAKEIHNGFFTYMVAFVGIALVAHLLTWIWKPWIPV